MRSEKYKLIFISLGIIAVLSGIIACHSMTDSYDQFIKNGEIIYPEKADSIIVRPGKNRLELAWPAPIDSTVTKAKIFWHTMTDSEVVPINKKLYKDTVRVLLTDLKEQPYSFIIYQYDADGNQSVKTSVAGKVYGENYKNSLLPQAIKRVFKMKNNLKIEWQGQGEATVVGSKIYYTDTLNKKNVKFSPPNEIITSIPDFDFKANDSFQYQTLYMPDSLAIDTFQTNTQKVNADL